MKITNLSLKITVWISSLIGFAVDTHILNTYGIDVMKDIRLIWVIVAFAIIFVDVEERER